MRRLTLISACIAVAAGALMAAAPAAVASTAVLSGPTSVHLPITGYFQMAVDSADDQVFISQGTSGGSSIVVTDFSGKVVGSIAEPSPVAGIALAPDGTALYAALAGSTTVSPAISVISTSSLTQTATLPLPVGDTPLDVAVQSGRLWVSYTVNAYEGGIGDFGLSASSPTLQTPSVMSHYAAAPMLAAGSSSADHVLVAVPVNDTPPLVATYDTSTAQAQSGGYPAGCSMDKYDYAMDIAVTPTTYAGGDGLVLACDSPAAAAEHVYSTSGMSEESPTYGTVGTPNSVAVAPAGGLVAVGGANVPQIAEVYTQGGNPTNTYEPVGSGGTLASRGLGLSADGSELFAVTSVNSGANPVYALNIYPFPGPVPPTLNLAATSANITLGQSDAITGTLLIGGQAPADTSIEITRTSGTGQSPTTFAAAIGTAGNFTWTDRPPAPGTYYYSVVSPATATSLYAIASARVIVAKAVPSLSLTVTPAAASYGQAVAFGAHFATNMPGDPPVTPVTVYAQVAGSTTRTELASGQLSGSGTVSGTAHFAKSVTLYAVYAGNADVTAVAVSKTVSVDAKVTASIGGYYATKSGYRLYHHAGHLKLSAMVAPVKKGECVKFQVQKYVHKAWQAVVITGCAALNAKSEASAVLAVSKYAQGIPYRVRADYLRGTDTSNLDDDSGFLDFMVKP